MVTVSPPPPTSMLGFQTLTPLSLPLNDHLEGKSTGVTGEERAMWPSCLPARKGDSIALASPLSPEPAFLKPSDAAAY